MNWRKHIKVGNEDRSGNIIEKLNVFSNLERFLGNGNDKVLDEETLAKAHRYILFNYDSIESFISQHLVIIQQQFPHTGKHEIERIHSVLVC